MLGHIIFYMPNFIPLHFACPNRIRSIDKLTINTSTLVGSVNLPRKADPTCRIVTSIPSFLMGLSDDMK